MGQHWLLSKQVRDLSAIDVARMSKTQAFNLVCEVKWGKGKFQVCPWCGVIDTHSFFKLRSNWTCKHCFRPFSVTTKTIWADRKLPLHKMLFMLFEFSSSPNGISASLLSRKAKVSYRTAWIFCHKVREAIQRHIDLKPMSGEVHVDGGHFGGKPRSGPYRRKAKPEAIANKIKLGKNQGARRSRITRQNLERKIRNRRIVIVTREVKPSYGAVRTRCILANSEDESVAMHIAKNFINAGSLVRTDESSAYSCYSKYFEHETVEHSKEYCTPDGINNNQAESYFSRLRRSEYGTFHRMMARYMIDYANEMAWREDTRRKTESERFFDVLSKCLSPHYSRWWRGYNQGVRRNDELIFKPN